MRWCRSWLRRWHNDHYIRLHRRSGSREDVLSEELLILTLRHCHTDLTEKQGYLTEMCKAVKSKGATCLIASVTPKNKFSGDSLNYNSPYTSQAKLAASTAGGTYVPHLEAIGKQVANQGISVAQQYWLSGNPLQSNAAGADAFASAFAGELRATSFCCRVSVLSFLI